MAEPDRVGSRVDLPQTGYQPSVVQISRVDQAERFTRVYVYLPLGISSGIVAILTLFLLYLAIFPPSPLTRTFLSGLADFVLVMFMIPVVILFGLVLVGIIGGYIYYKFILDEEERPIPPGPAYGRIRTLLWRIDHLFVRIQPKLLDASDRIAAPIIRFNIWFAAVFAWLKSWWK